MAFLQLPMLDAKGNPHAEVRIHENLPEAEVRKLKPGARLRLRPGLRRMAAAEAAADADAAVAAEVGSWHWASHPTGTRLRS